MVKAIGFPRVFDDRRQKPYETLGVLPHPLCLTWPASRRWYTVIGDDDLEALTLAAHPDDDAARDGDEVRLAARSQLRDRRARRRRGRA